MIQPGRFRRSMYRHALGFCVFAAKEPVLSTAVVILAAGQGTRMKSSKAKVLHAVGGKPMVMRAVETAEKVSNAQPVLVIGHAAEAVQSIVGARAQFVIQADQRGTGHAVMQAESALKGKADIIAVLYCDMPLVRPGTMLQLIETQRKNQGPITLLTLNNHDARGFARIIHGER